MSENKTILLTGATGFIGSYLLEKLLDKNYKVVVLKRSFSNISRIKNLLNGNVSAYDIDKIDLEEVFRNENVDGIIHCATEYGKNSNSASKIIETNVLFPVKILDLAIKYNVEVFINTDSYFCKNEYSYLKNYSLSKKYLYSWLENFSEKIKIINMQLEHPYGYSDNNDKFCKFIFNKIVLEHAESIDLTAGEQRRDFVYIDDVTEAYSRALSYGFENDFKLVKFEIGTGKTASIKDFVTYILEKNNSQQSCKLNFGKIPYRADEIMESVADITLFKELKFQPKYDYKAGIDLMFEEYYRIEKGI